MAVFPFSPMAALGDPMTLAKLVAGVAPSQLTQSAPSAPSPGQTPPIAPPPGGNEYPEIVVQNDPLPKSKYKTGIIQGFLRPGSTGGNILGALGDAFLTQAGHAPRYAPRLQQLREAEALENFGSDPAQAAALMTQVNPDASLKMYSEIGDERRAEAENARREAENERASALQAAKLRQAEQEYGETIDARAIAMLGNANAKTYPAIRQRALDYFKKHNRQPPFELPETFDEASVQAIRMSQVPVGKQMELADRRSYQQAQAQTGRQRAAAQAESARASTIRATRPPTPRADTTGNVIAGIMRKDPAKRTPEEKRLLSTWEARGQGGGKKAAGGGGGWVKNPQTGKYERR